MIFRADCVFFGNDFGTQLDLLISPSHERIQPNVPAANVIAMARAAKKEL